jgi:hypothetical protein
MKTAEETVAFPAPQLRDTVEPFLSAVRENLAGRTEALEDLAVELFARGLSTRDIEAAFTDTDGRRLVSRAAVSEIPGTAYNLSTPPREGVVARADGHQASSRPTAKRGVRLPHRRAA